MNDKFFTWFTEKKLNKMFKGVPKPEKPKKSIIRDTLNNPDNSIITIEVVNEEIVIRVKQK